MLVAADAIAWKYAPAASVERQILKDGIIIGLVFIVMLR
jgi:hypothetical protein